MVKRILDKDVNDVQFIEESLRELAEWFKAVSLRLIWFIKSHPFKSDILWYLYNKSQFIFRKLKTILKFKYKKVVK